MLVLKVLDLEDLPKKKIMPTTTQKRPKKKLCQQI